LIFKLKFTETYIWSPVETDVMFRNYRNITGIIWQNISGKVKNIVVHVSLKKQMDMNY
jgi:hypothetical protein